MPTLSRRPDRRPVLDRPAVELIATRIPHSNVRQAAVAWLHAFDLALARGTAEAEALALANHAWDDVCTRVRAARGAAA